MLNYGGRIGLGSRGRSRNGERELGEIKTTGILGNRNFSKNMIPPNFPLLAGQCPPSEASHGQGFTTAAGRFTFNCIVPCQDTIP